ncbi:MAG: hypothetical protein NZR01_01645 [Bryobacteraceae bacterium]|nr:hypothetical protein [Bryobacteraceae bacterium]
MSGLRREGRAEPAAALRAGVERFLASCRDPVLLEPGEAPFALSEGHGLHLSARGACLLLEAWDGARTLARRIVGIVEARPARLVLATERFGGRSGTLALADRAAPAAAPALARGSRAVLLERLRRWLARQFPGWQLRDLSAGMDLENSLSPACPRALLTLGTRRLAAIAADAAHASAALAQGLLWLDCLRRRDGVDTRALALFLPRGSETAAALCLPHLCVEARLFLYGESGDEEPAAFEDAGNRVRELAPWIDPPPPAAGESARWVHELALEEAVETIPAAPGEWALRIRGLEFARWRRGALLYGVPPRRRARRIEPVRALARQLAVLRSPSGPDPSHPWRLAQPEAWLDAVLRAHLPLIDPLLRPAPLYTQISALEAGDRAIADLLALRRDGRLVLVEIKAAPDPCLPLQALEYWARIACHAARGEFARRGYFPSLAVSPQPPKLVLAAPALAFHPATEILLGFFRPGIEVERVGLGVEWQQNPRVVLRVRGALRPEWDGGG